MSVGYPAGKNDIDAKVGGLAVQLRNTLVEVANFKLWLDAQTDADLTAASYSATDIARLRSAINDLDRLHGIYLGTATQTTTYDFRTFAKFLTGMA
jgi:hypothetical protein